MRYRIGCMIAAGLFILVAGVAGVLAQTKPEEPREVNMKFFAISDGEKSQTATFTFVASELGFESKVVKASPFSADTETEFTQTLSNGQHISRKSTASIYRDSEGRIRREQTIDAIGAYSPSGSVPKTISINDPVAGVSYMLDPDSRTAIMNKVPSGTDAVHVVTTPFGGYAVSQKGGTVAGAAGVTSVMVDTQPGMMVARKTPFGTTMVSAGLDRAVRTEPLGVQVMEGVQVEGTRTIETIPTGAIGNDGPIEIVSERWYSPELEMVVKSTRNDPMSGENVYQLKNISRGDPPSSLFQIPADYTVKEGVIIKTQTIKKENQ
jgi:hypothetical protein